MLIKKKQYNSWIDDSYLLIGISHFYKRNFPEAEETFKYITKQFKKEQIRHEANLWLARLAIEQGEFTRATTLLERLDENKVDFPKGMNQSFYEVYTHLHMEQNDYEQSIDRLKQAIAVTKKKDRRARQSFLLAQLYDLTGKSRKSVSKYGEVVKMNPDYEMKFYAQINQALAFDSRSDSEQIRSQLNKMLRDEKYLEFRDQIYYALAEVEFAERHTSEGIQMLLRSAEASINNNRQKGKSFLRLADIYFDERNYEVASEFYDSTMTYLPTDYPNYEVISATKESLSDLVYYLRIVDREDSLQTLAQMEPSELDKKLKKIIKQKRAEEEEKRRLQQEQQQQEFQNRQNLQAQQANDRAGRGSNSSGKWYFYNEGSKSIGFAEFRTKFGQRDLKDNWRRKNKQEFIEIGEDGEEGETASKGDGAKIPTLAELKADIPFTDEEMKASSDSMASALFEVGKIYKDNLEDYDNAIETFEDLNVRLPGNSHEQMAYYQLYRLFLKKEEDPRYFPSDPRSTSEYYASLITEDFPDSEYSKLIKDPDYMASTEQARVEEREAYESTFRMYRQRRYTDVMVSCLDVMNNDEENKLLPKYYLLRAMSIAGKKDRANFIGALREIVAKFPKTEEGDEAARLLGILKEEVKEKEEEKETTGIKLPGTEEKEEDKPKGNYVLKDDMDHYFAMLVPNKGSKMNELKGKVADFNREYFRSETFKVTNSFINSDYQILLVRTFGDKTKGMQYLTAYNNEEGLLTGVNDQGHDAFVITSKNFATLFKSKDISGYIEFFKANYE